MNIQKDDFYLMAQELWETEGNATQLNEEVNAFYYRFLKKLQRNEVEE